jgi:hypothetical protein
MAMRSRFLCTFTALALLAWGGDARAQWDNGGPEEPHAAPVAPAPTPVRAPPAAPAANRTRNLGFLIRMNFDFGGDVVEEVSWTNGDSTKLKAGQLITFAGGVLYRPQAPWALETTLGYKFDKANGSNGTIEFTRIPLDVIASWANGGHRLGGGATLHFSPTFRCDATGVCSTTSSFDTALGGIVQYAYGYAIGNHGYDVGVRYTKIRYAGSGLPTIDGSGFGFFFGGWL